ncbi:SPFH domain-containing protein [Corynebacterium uropygiale]|uniref:SPFH domain-containing protein n=1 Tax=Corynebacterium uropygiale TaxID=1775911 RepID=A0A9X1QS14_9CORY|nr:SPFH domain-containing protein [Corynebacterium uropygiale]MCF4007120.1 SPFH domain-containing protein [Corynebacterium uropygiale]
MSDTTPAVADTPVGRDGTRVSITERPAKAGGAGLASLALLVVLVILALCAWGFVSQAIADDNGTAGPNSGICMFVCFVVFLVTILLGVSSFTIVQPGHTKVLTFFGTYVGTVRRTGFNLVPPLTRKQRVSVRVHNFETNEAKVNDYNGNPITISAIIVWQVADTATASFAVENYEKFIRSQAESALRHVATQHPYDSDIDGRVSLRGGTDDVSSELAHEVAERAAVASLEIVEARISSLSYAPEIAQAMLQRQQASAIVDARETIVDGAVSMVRSALDQLEAEGIVDLDPERRAAMVSNLLVVLCSDNHTQPVVNTGGLYS